jgi:hypothetical protein
MSPQVDMLIARVESCGHSVWISGPATSDAGRRIEEALGSQLPPSCVSFLRSRGAMSIHGQTVSGVTDGDVYDDGCGAVIGDTKTLQRDGKLPAGFVVISPHEDGAYCLDLSRRHSDGEYPIVNFERGSVQHTKRVAE